MPLFAAGTLATMVDSLKMSFQNVHFLFFLPVAVGVYFALPGRWRKGWLLLASYYFYFFAAPHYLPVLLAGTLITYLAGRLIAAAGTQKSKRACMLVGVTLSVLCLAFFKYNGILAQFLSPLSQRFGFAYEAEWFTTAAALGISYYTFTAIGYMIDVYRGDVPAEKNLATYALFLGFFPSVSMGPISRAGALIPQLTDTSRRFDAQSAVGALQLIAIGYFQKMAVADTLAVFVRSVYAAPQDFAGFTLSLAALCFMLQLYFDFAGYTNIARGAAKLFGIRLPQNFDNPYFSTNFSGFWARWHMSFSTWLQDYIFTPLVWSRWPEKLPIIGKYMKKPPVLSSLFIVFAVSGLWHGDTLCFLVWGLLQAAFRIGEELLHRFWGKPKKKLPLAKRIGKTAFVLWLWMESLVFFAVGLFTPNGTVGTAVAALLRQFSGFSLTATWQAVYTAVLGVYNNNLFVFLFLFFSLACLLLALWADWAQCFKLKGKSLVIGLQRLHPLPKWLLYYVLVLGCFAGFLLQNGGFMGGSFLYNNF